MRINPKRPATDQRLRHKLSIWRIDVFVSPRARRMVRVCHAVKDLVPPRVLAALIRTWFNGWVTKGRFQVYGWESTCMWGCSCRDGDSLKHYSVCPVLARWRRSIGLMDGNSVESRRAAFMMLKKDIDDCPSRMAWGAMAVYSIYQTYNLLVHRPAPAAEAYNALKQGLREGARGHDRAEKILCTRCK